MGPPDEPPEQEIKACLARGDLKGALTVAIRGYGGEIYSFLHAFDRTGRFVDDLYSTWCERLWTGLPTFRGDSSFRTWAYTIARNVGRNFLDSERVRRRVHAQMPEDSDLAQIAEQVRSETAEWLRTQEKDRIRRLRESLTPDEQVILTLHVDRKLTWKEIAVVMNDGAAELTKEELERHAARWRKRYQAVREKLAELIRKDRKERR